MVLSATFAAVTDNYYDMKQEKRITYKAGITRTPSDFLCGDGELAECINLTTDNEELKPVVPPAVKYESEIREHSRLVFVHRFNKDERLIFLSEYNTHTYTVDWYVPDGSGGMTRKGSLEDPDGNVVKINLDENGLHGFSQRITAIGKVLIVIGDNGISYYTWKPDGYTRAVAIPQQEADFRLEYNLISETYASAYETGWSGNPKGIIEDGMVVDQEKYNDFVVGLYERNVRHINTAKLFCRPFLVCTALELYDGSYIYNSQPMIMFPCVRENSYMRHYSDSKAGLHTESFALWVRQETEGLSELSEFVRDVVVFVTEGVDPHELTRDQPFGGWVSKVTTDAVAMKYGLREQGMTYYKSTPTGGDLASMPLYQKSADDIKLELESQSIFYKLCSIGLKAMDWTDTRSFIRPHTLENLVSQPRLDSLDRHSRCALYPELAFAYNARLNLSGVHRGFFEGFGKFLPYQTVQVGDYEYQPNGHSRYTFFVTIQTDEGEKTVRHVEETQYYQGIYFFYPDSRARHVVIYANSGETDIGECVLNADLKEHPGLNGAYYFKGLPGDKGKEETVTGPDGKPSADNRATEYLPNAVITSEVYNPWVFRTENKVGTGRIIGMSTVTRAMSQGQFGQYPLIVFSDSGIWAMSVDGTGLFSSVHPMSREVCINPRNITQTDGAVFFVSKKGLMVVSGSDVSCVSTRMNGTAFDTQGLRGLDREGLQEPAETIAPWKGIITASQGSGTFLSYIRDEACFMAYDYVDSRLLIINPNYGYAFVFNMADGTVSKTVIPPDVQTAVNDYPDYLLYGESLSGGDRSACIRSLYGKPREEEVTVRQTAFLLTRPMKLAGPDTVVSLRELVNVGVWDEAGGSCVKTELWLSDNMRDWHEASSRFGAAARYWRLALYIRMLPTERLSGTIIMEQERRTNNQRT